MNVSEWNNFESNDNEGMATTNQKEEKTEIFSSVFRFDAVAV